MKLSIAAILCVLCVVAHAMPAKKKRCKQRFGGLSAADIGSNVGIVSRYPAPTATLPYQPPRADCHLAQVQWLNRHGTRNPTAGVVAKLDALADFLNSLPADAIPDTLQSLRHFVNPFNATGAGLLVPQGVQDLRGIASRVKVRYGGFVNASTTVARADNQSRVLESGHAFLSEMFGEGVVALNVLKRGSALLSPNIKCKKLDAKVKTVQSQSKTFDKTHFSEMARSLNKTIAGAWTAELAQAAVTLCAFQVAINGDNTDICRLFSANDINLYSLSSDLSFNEKDGYESPVPHPGCGTLTDFAANLDNMASGKPQTPQIVLNFGHAETVGPFLAALGLYNDTVPLNAVNVLGKHKWRTPTVAPFATNVAAELYVCQTSEPLVRFLHNEQPKRLPGACSGSEYCPLSAFKKQYQSLIGCDLDALCGNAPGTKPASVSAVLPA
ncbi:PHOsphatase [Sorochytrium milnesiophthora]